MDYDIISEFGVHLLDKFKKLSYNDLELSDYYRYYLERVSSSRIQHYSYILWLALKDIANYRNTVLVDYGGGLGLLSLLAKGIGINTVIYNDIDCDASHDAQRIGASVKTPADYYICG